MDSLITGLLACGHVLLEGQPGLGKTELVKGLAAATGLDSRRLQFTPDLLPGDITGNPVLQEADGKRQFVFQPGPIFANLVLADEINRASPKTQSSLLEAMQERQVTVIGTTHKLPDPFFVMATQNPIELEGTYPLPEAQLDRFIFNVILDYLDADQEVAVVERNTLGQGLPTVDACIDAASLLEIQGLVRQVPISDAMNRLAVDIVRATRPDQAEASDRVRKYVMYGASVRAAIFLSLAARARALLKGRYHVIPEDVQTLAAPVLRHRVQLNYLAESEQVTVDDLIDELASRTG